MVKRASRRLGPFVLAGGGDGDDMMRDSHQGWQGRSSLVQKGAVRVGGVCVNCSWAGYGGSALDACASALRVRHNGYRGLRRLSGLRHGRVQVGVANLVIIVISNPISTGVTIED